jgi:hypothetical protein
MQKVLQWGVPNVTEVTNENVGQILYAVQSRDSMGMRAMLKDLNKVEFGIFIKRGSAEETTVFDGYLGDMVQFLYGGSHMLDVVLQFDSSYAFSLNFAHRFNIGANDVLRIKTNFGSASNAFTNGDDAKSSIVLYTNPSSVPNPENYTAIYKSFQVPNGDLDFDRNIGTNVSKILLHTHPTNTFNSGSNTPRPISTEIVASGYSSDKQQIELYTETRDAFGSTYGDIKNLVAYNSKSLLTNAKIKIKLDKPATVDTKVLVTSYRIA